MKIVKTILKLLGIALLSYWILGYISDKRKEEELQTQVQTSLRSQYAKAYTLVTDNPRIDVSRRPRVYTVVSVSPDEVRLECRESIPGFLMQPAWAFYGWKTFNPKTLKGRWHAEDSTGNKQDGTLLLSNNPNGGYDIQVSYDWIETKATAYDNTPGCNNHVDPYKGRLRPKQE
jgi:hypothetical protein